MTDKPCCGILCKCESCQDIMSGWSEKFGRKGANPFVEILKEREDPSEDEDKDEK